MQDMLQKAQVGTVIFLLYFEDIIRQNIETLQQRYTQRREKAFGMCPEVRLMLIQTGLIRWNQSEINSFTKLIFEQHTLTG